MIGGPKPARSVRTEGRIRALNRTIILRAAQQVFANEKLRGSAVLSPRELRNIRAITREKAIVIESWIKAGKLKPADPADFFVMLWAATQFYADFDAVVRNVLDTRHLSRAHFDKAAKTIASVVLEGCTFPEGGRRARSRRA